MSAAYTFNRKLLAACALTRRIQVEKMIRMSTELPTFEAIFVEGQLIVGATESVMTMAFDGSEAAKSNPPTNPRYNFGKMPFDHAALIVTPELLNKLTSSDGPEEVKITILEDQIDWTFNEGETVTITDIIDYSEDEIDGELQHDDYHYPDYRELVRRAAKEIADFQGAHDVKASAFSVALGANTTQLLVRIVKSLGLPSDKIEGRWREGESSAFLITGGTPNYHVVRYYDHHGYFRNDIFTLIGSSKRGLHPSPHLFPEFALREGLHRPNRVWEFIELGEEPKQREGGQATGEIIDLSLPGWDHVPSKMSDDDYTDDDLDEDSQEQAKEDDE